LENNFKLKENDFTDLIFPHYFSEYFIQNW